MLTLSFELVRSALQETDKTLINNPDAAAKLGKIGLEKTTLSIFIYSSVSVLTNQQSKTCIICFVLGYHI